MGIEIERKYLVKYPTGLELATYCDRIIEITQTYLKSEEGVDRRVRLSAEGGKITYTYTVKTHISGISRNEDEREITEEEYNVLLSEADEDFNPINKIRYCIPMDDGHVAEVDIYQKIKEFAICEVELRDEKEQPYLPACLTPICEVTGNRHYSNRAFAKKKNIFGNK
jgi:CYTH domain-containing protein